MTAKDPKPPKPPKPYFEVTFGVIVQAETAIEAHDIAHTAVSRGKHHSDSTRPINGGHFEFLKDQYCVRPVTREDFR